MPLQAGVTPNAALRVSADRSCLTAHCLQSFLNKTTGWRSWSAGTWVARVG